MSDGCDDAAGSSGLSRASFQSLGQTIKKNN